MTKRTQQTITIRLVPIELLRPHERIMERHVKELMNEIVRDGRLIYPVLVDKETMIILDGHHRVEALKRLGARYIPAILVDYRSDEVRVSSWRADWKVRKKDVIEAGLKGELLPPKTSRHITRFKIPEVNVPLHVLFGGGYYVPKTHKFERSVQEEGA